MATKKKLLQAAAGTAAASGGAGGLNVEDVFSTYLYEGNGSAQVIENGINLGQSGDGGSAKFSGASTSSYIEVPNSTDFTLGSYYSLEANIWLETVTGSQTIFGRWYAANNNENYVFYVGSGGTVTGGVYPSYSQLQSAIGLQSGRWYHLLFSFDGSSLRLFIDGTLDQTVSNNQHYVTGTGTTPFSIGGNSDGGANFKGHISNVRVRKFTQSSQVPTSNFTAPTSPLTADAYTVLLTCQGDDAFTDNSASSHTVSAVSSDVTQSTFGPFDAADAGEGGLVWIKDRDAANGHNFYDTERGATKRLASNLTSAETTRSTGVTSFNASGFSGGSDASINTSGNTYASWTFRKAPKFFDCIQYSGTGTTGLVLNHDLGCEVGTVIIKRTDAINNWYVHHRSVGGTQHLLLDGTGAATSYGGTELTTSTTSITINMANNITNASGGTYVAYLFAHNNGDGDFGPTGDQDIIKCGSYTTDANEDATIDLGWEPQWVLAKRTDSSTGGTWMLFDNMRGLPADFITQSALIEANDTNAESNVNRMILTPTGFKVDNYGANRDYIYIAIRRGPMAVPTAATDVFNVHDEVGEPSTSPLYLGNTDVIDMVLSRNRYKAGGYNYITDRLRGSGTISYTDNTNAETSGLTYIEFDHNTNNYIAAGGYGNNSGGTSEDSVFWQWKRAPNFFDVVAYTGNGTAGRTVSHNLGVAPEMMWVKCLSNTYSWSVYHKGCNGGVNPEQYRLVLNDTFAETANSTRWNDTAPTESVFTLGTATQGNASGENYIAYLFASLDGVSKVGSYTGTGAGGNQIDCGFSSGARFVLIKAASSAGSWNVFDTERGIVAGNDARLKLNNTNAEDSTTDIIDPYNSGFELANDAGDTNSSGVTYIFYAIA